MLNRDFQMIYYNSLPSRPEGTIGNLPAPQEREAASKKLKTAAQDLNVTEITI